MKKFKIKIYSKIILIDIIIALIMSILVPVLANYPPHSEELAFQSQVLKVSHIWQYFILLIVTCTIHLIMCKFIFKNSFNYVKKFPAVSDDEVIKVRFETYKANRRLLISTIITFVIDLVLLINMIIFNSWLIAKLSLILFSLLMSSWIMQTILIKSNLKDLVKSTYEVYPSVTLSNKIEKLYISLLKDTLPIFIVILILISLLGYSLVQNQIGNNYYL